MFKLPKLPYEENALEPYISRETIEYHYGKHHQAYVTNLNNLILDTKYEGQSLEQIIVTSSGPIFNNAAQVWNHTFYWNSMSPNSTQVPVGIIKNMIEEEFGSFDTFKEAFSKAALTTFGSGWTWLVKGTGGKLSIISTSNAHCPLVDGYLPLLTCDVWEHAYYVDYRNARPEYVKNFWKVVNWDFVASNIT
jgi:Fe-Mn family superoxide dismutase